MALIGKPQQGSKSWRECRPTSDNIKWKVKDNTKDAGHFEFMKGNE
jgi:hypothetical protein